ncbi:hypothetical protein D3C73_1143610 [compost metagenome]
MPALALHHHQQHLGHVLGDFLAMVIGHHREREVNAGGNAPRSDEVTVLHENLIGLHLRFRKSLDQPLGVMPVGSDPVTVD